MKEDVPLQMLALCKANSVYPEGKTAQGHSKALVIF